MGIPKVTGRKPNGLRFCINIGELDVDRRNFSKIDLWDYVVRRTISFCNKELQVSYWRKLGGIFQMLCYGSIECELFHFQLVSINYEIVLTLWTYVLVMNVLLFILWNFHCGCWMLFINNELSCCSYIYKCSCGLK